MLASPLSSSPSAVQGSPLAAYAKDGVVLLRQVFDERWLELLRAGIQRELARPGPNYSVHLGEGSRGRSHSSLCSWNTVPEFREFLFSSPAARIAADILGETAVQLVEEQWFIKECHALDRTPWHQDQPFFDIDAPLCSIWLPLDFVPREDGLEFIRSSHREGTFFLPEHLHAQMPGEGRAESRYQDVPDIEAERDRFDIVAWEMNPGDCVVFSGMTLHGGAANRASRQAIRRFSSRWSPLGARCMRRGLPWSGLPSPSGLPSEHQRTGQLLDERVFPVVRPA